VIKHTHHSITSTVNRGDTLAFLEAGAQQTMLAAPDGEAFEWHSDGSSRRFPWVSAEELVSQCEAEIVFVEGFTSVGSWPRLATAYETVPNAPAVVAVVSETKNDSAEIVWFARDDVAGVARFLDTIAAP
jgi:molybdopterin-guanine dinucleotide biosynthesis protein MobB